MNADNDSSLDPLAASVMHKLLTAGLPVAVLERIGALDEHALAVFVRRLASMVPTDDVLDRPINPCLGGPRQHLEALQGLAEKGIRTYRQLLAGVDWTAARPAGGRSLHRFRALGPKAARLLVEHLIALRLLGEDARVVLRR